MFILLLCPAPFPAPMSCSFDIFAVSTLNYFPLTTPSFMGKWEMMIKLFLCNKLLDRLTLFSPDVQSVFLSNFLSIKPNERQICTFYYILLQNICMPKYENKQLRSYLCFFHIFKCSVCVWIERKKMKEEDFRYYIMSTRCRH